MLKKLTNRSIIKILDMPTNQQNFFSFVEREEECKTIAINFIYLNKSCYIVIIDQHRYQAKGIKAFTTVA